MKTYIVLRYFSFPKVAFSKMDFIWIRINIGIRVYFYLQKVYIIWTFFLSRKIRCIRTICYEEHLIIFASSMLLSIDVARDRLFTAQSSASYIFHRVGLTAGDYLRSGRSSSESITAKHFTRDGRESNLTSKIRRCPRNLHPFTATRSPSK